MKKLFLIPLVILLVAVFILAGCSQSASAPTTSAPATTSSAPTTTAPNTTAPTTTAPTTSTAPTATTTGPTKTFTFGLVTDLTGTLGIQVMNWMNVICDMTNAQGGLQIGNDHYIMKCITYSNDNDINKGIAATNRLVFQDKVQYIIEHQPPSDTVLPITDPNKVICFSQAGIWNSGFLDKWHYSFALLGQGTHEISVAGWLAENHPEIKGPDGLAFALPDNAVGHITAAYVSYPYKAMGCQPQFVYFPADQRDLSSLGTKIAVMNPAWYFPNIGKVEDMALASSAAYDAGYRGHYFSFLTSDEGLLQPIFEPGVLEGFIDAESAMETNPPMTPLAAQMKAAYVAKYGTWDYPDYMTTPSLLTLMAALQKAGTTDTDAVAAVLHQGLSGINVPDGTLNMITRPDMNTTGNCLDGVMDNSLKQIHNDQAVTIAHFGPDQSLKYVRQGYPPLPPGATPSIVPPM